MLNGRNKINDDGNVFNCLKYRICFKEVDQFNIFCRTCCIHIGYTYISGRNNDEVGTIEQNNRTETMKEESIINKV